MNTALWLMNQFGNAAHILNHAEEVRLLQNHCGNIITKHFFKAFTVGAAILGNLF
jgi:hypothetical protein